MPPATVLTPVPIPPNKLLNIPPSALLGKPADLVACTPTSGRTSPSP